jgi:adenylylsulfate kinase
LEICEARDVKGSYKKARAGQIPNFTGISSPYEIPENPELTLLTGTAELDTCVQQVITELTNRSVIASI